MGDAHRGVYHHCVLAESTVFLRAVWSHTLSLSFAHSLCFKVGPYCLYGINLYLLLDYLMTRQFMR